MQYRYYASGMVIPEENSVERDELLFSYLRALIPKGDATEISRLVRERPEGGLVEVLAEIAQGLGVRLYRVRSTLPELLNNSAGTPALELGEAPRVIIGPEGESVLVQEGASRRAVPLGAWGEETRAYLIPSPRMTLASLRGRQGLRRVLSYLATERSLLKSIVVYAIFIEGLNLAAPLAVQVLINTIGFGMMTQQLIVISGLLMLALVGAAVLSLLQIVMVEHLSRRFFARALVEFSERVPLSPRRGMSNPVHRFFEVVSVDKSFFVFGLDLIALFLQLLAATLLLALYHPILLGFTVVMLLSGWLVLHLPFAYGLKRSIEESHAKYELADFLQRGGTDEVERAGLWAHWLSAREAGFRISLGQQAGLFATQVVLSVALLLVGGGLVIAGELTLGQLVAAELVAGTALMSMSKLGKQLPKVYDLVTSFEKLGAVVDLPLEEGPPSRIGDDEPHGAHHVARGSV